GDVDVAAGRRDRERLRRVDASAPEVRGLVERGKAAVQPRDECIEVAGNRRLGAAAGAREVGRVREPGNVHAGWSEFDRSGGIGVSAAEIRGRLQGGEVRVQSRHETIDVTAEGA